MRMLIGVAADEEILSLPIARILKLNKNGFGWKFEWWLLFFPNGNSYFYK